MFYKFNDQFKKEISWKIKPNIYEKKERSMHIWFF
jgi:hypothetical protein